jgi:ABC-type polysaccharide/polyol phosphate export permease
MSNSSSFSLACKDIFEGFMRYDLWPSLAWQEIKRRYRRSTLGPLWLTISTGAFVIGLGPLYGKLFNQDLAAYLPYIAISFVLWALLSGMITDSCTVFVAEESIFKQIKLPFSIFCYALVTRNLIILAHNAVIILLVFLFYPPPLTPVLLLFPVGLLLIALNGLWMSLSLGILCTRFRDIPQIVASVLQITMFLTPVMWKADMVDRYSWIVDWNPMNHFLELVRAPLYGNVPPSTTWLAVACITVVGWAVTLMVFARYRTRIPYWV